MKILAAVIIPPHLSVSGAVNAAMALSRAAAEHGPVDLAIMAEEDGTAALGAARILRRRCRNPLGFTRGILPNKFRTLFYRADIPDLVAGYDLVHIHNPMPALEMKRVARACRAAGVPYVVSTHGYFEVNSGGDAYQLRNPLLKQVWKHAVEEPVRWVTRNADTIFALSPMDVDLVESLGVPRDRIRIVTNGVNERMLEAPPAGDVGPVLDAYGIRREKSAPVAIFLGNHTANKGLPVLVEAFHRLQAPFELVVCGKKRGGVDYAGMASGLRPGQRIVFTDLVRDEHLPTLLQHADVFVYPTLSDTLPLVVLEAMAAGLPIVATRVGGIPFQVRPDFGVLVPPGDPAALADAYRDFVAAGDLAAKGRLAREYVLANFRWEQVGALAHREYARVLDTCRSGAGPGSKAGN